MTDTAIRSAPVTEYSTPELIEYGTLRDITLTVGPKGTKDCGGGLGTCSGGTSVNFTSGL